jgi:hypothetical protein
MGGTDPFSTLMLDYPPLYYINGEEPVSYKHSSLLHKSAPYILKGIVTLASSLFLTRNSNIFINEIYFKTFRSIYHIIHTIVLLVSFRPVACIINV